MYLKGKGLDTVRVVIIFYYLQVPMCSSVYIKCVCPILLIFGLCDHMHGLHCYSQGVEVGSQRGLMFGSVQ